MGPRHRHGWLYIRLFSDRFDYSQNYSQDNHFQLFDTLSVLTLVFLLFLILPSVPFYKHLEKQSSEASAQQSSNDLHRDKYQLGPRSDKLPYTICQ